MTCSGLASGGKPRSWTVKSLGVMASLSWIRISFFSSPRIHARPTRKTSVTMMSMSDRSRNAASIPTVGWYHASSPVSAVSFTFPSMVYSRQPPIPSTPQPALSGVVSVKMLRRMAGVDSRAISANSAHRRRRLRK